MLPINFISSDVMVFMLLSRTVQVFVMDTWCVAAVLYRIGMPTHKAGFGPDFSRTFPECFFYEEKAK